MHLPDDWREAADRIASRSDAASATVLVVGVPDAGKSTFCAYAASRFAGAGRRTGVVDADVGQSCIGPPAAISGGLLAAPVRSLAEIEPSAGYFVGSISPEGHLLACVVGVQHVMRRLREQGAQAVVVDTSGLALGGTGRALKEHKADLLQPTDIVVIQSNGELENLARLWERAETASVHRLHPSPQAVMRTAAQRRAYRRERFAAAFKSASPIHLPFGRIALRGTWLLQGTPRPSSDLARLTALLQTPVVHAERLGSQALLVTSLPIDRQVARIVQGKLKVDRVMVRPASLFANLVCGLLNGAGDLLAPAILQRVDFAAGAVQLLVAPARQQEWRVLHLGRVQVRVDGEELGILQPADL